MDKVVSQLSKAWWLTPNERRQGMNYDPSADSSMDKVYIPQNLTPIDETGLTPAEMQALAAREYED